MRTPLASILGYLETVKNTPGMPAPALRSIEVAGRNAQRLLNLVSDVPPAAANAMELRPQDVDLMEIVRGAVASQQQAAPATGLDLRLVGPESLLLRANPERMGQDVDNLVSKAVKYTPSGCRSA